jgi:fermentation-respiration switch protein FrsA (DUF1100 family)
MSINRKNKDLRSILFMSVPSTFILLLIFIFIAASIVFYPRIENRFVFYPQSSFDLTPEDLRLEYKDVYFNSGDGYRLHGWFFPLQTGGSVILFFHGNAGNISHRLENVRLLTERNLQVFIFDYRGYGKSSGKPSEKGIYVDGLAAYDYLVEKEHISPGNVVLFGRSLGGAVAIETALNRDTRSIIVESAFASIKEMAKTMFPFNLFSFMLPSHYDNLNKISDINVPKLIIHGEEDEIVPFSMSKRLFEASRQPKFFYTVKGAGHNDTFIAGGDEYFENFVSFVNESKLRDPSLK